MQLAIIFFCVIYFAYWGSLIHVLRVRKTLDRPIFVTAILLILSSLIPDTFNGINVLLNIASPLPHRIYYAYFPWVVYYIYRTNNIVKRPTPFITVLLIIFTLSTLYTTFSTHLSSIQHSIPGFVSLIIVVAFSCYHFYRLFKELEVPNLLHAPIFWVSSCLLFYGAGTIVMELFEPLIISQELYYALWPVHQAVLIGYIVLINIVIQVGLKHPAQFQETEQSASLVENKANVL